MEKIFHARWWDYSRRKYNINGRICLETMIPFGILGTFVIYFLHPLVMRLIGYISPKIQLIIAIFFLVLYFLDNVLTYFVLNKIKKEIQFENKDNTEIIRERVLLWLNHHSYLYKRIKDAYPNFQIALRELKEEIRVKKEKRKSF